MGVAALLRAEEDAGAGAVAAVAQNQLLRRVRLRFQGTKQDN